MPLSMTGFARLEQQQPWGALSCEIRSVNHRYLEPSFRLPETLRAIENELRNVLKNKLARGKVEVSLQFKTEQVESADLQLNQSLARQIRELAEGLQGQIQRAREIDPMDILRWPGVVQSGELNQEMVQQAALALFSEGLSALIDMRAREGAELGKLITQRLDDIGNHLLTLRQRLPEILESHQAKLREKLGALAIDIDEDRLAQELVFCAQKSDVAEELDRLEAHITEVRRTLKQKEPVGRRLDFLMQELNREANTLSSKSMAVDTTQIAVELKVLIEQMREQVQNIE